MQLDLAKEIRKPIVIHSRDAAKVTLDILISSEYQDMSGIIHCYSYNKEIAKEYLSGNYYFGIGGVITFSNAKKLVEAVQYIPIDRIVLETDAPYLAPSPNRGKRNDSRNLIYVAEKIAEIKKIKIEEVIEITSQNAIQCYHLPL